MTLPCHRLPGHWLCIGFVILTGAAPAVAQPPARYRADDAVDRALWLLLWLRFRAWLRLRDCESTTNTGSKTRVRIVGTAKETR